MSERVWKKMLPPSTDATLNSIISSFDDEELELFRKYGRSDSPECLSQKSKHYWIHNTSNKEKLNLIKWYVSNSSRLNSNLSDSCEEFEKENNRLKRDYAPPRYEI